MGIRLSELCKTKQRIVSTQASNFGRDPEISFRSEHWLTKAFVQFVFRTQQKLKCGGGGGAVGGGGWDV